MTLPMLYYLRRCHITSQLLHQLLSLPYRMPLYHKAAILLMPFEQPPGWDAAISYRAAIQCRLLYRMPIQHKVAAHFYKSQHHIGHAIRYPFTVASSLASLRYIAHRYTKACLTPFSTLKQCQAGPEVPSAKTLFIDMAMPALTL